MVGSRRSYSTDLTEPEWQILEPLLPALRSRAADTAFTNCAIIINALRYLLRTGCSWRLLPHDFPHWRAVYEYFKV